MASKGLIAMFGEKKSKAPAFGDEGPPSAEDEPRGSGAGFGEAEPDESGGEGDYGAMEEAAADNLADVLGVPSADRADFGAALKAYVSACVARAMGDQGEQEEEAQEPEPMRRAMR